MESKKAERNEYWDRFIWSDYCFTGAAESHYPYVGGESERSATYLLNFFKCQPALNYGWLDPKKPWQMRYDSDAAIATREAMKDVCRFWMDRGCDGFRVDMASSLVKDDDEKKTGTSLIWKNIREMFDKEYPECALISEWSAPSLALRAGFHMDFLLNEPGSGYGTLVRDYQNHAGRNILGDDCFTGLSLAEEKPSYEDHSYFLKDSGGDIRAFLEGYLKTYEDTKDKGYISMITCNHDTVRPSFNLSEQEMKLFYCFLFTMPGVPFLYYGDEIGMHYQSLRTKEGGYFRTGSRTPMQWTSGKNLGFSEADSEKLYLPVDPNGAAQSVEEQEGDPDSLLNTVKGILSLRHSDSDLGAEPNLEILHAETADPLFVYRRGQRIVAMNPSSGTVSSKIDAADREKLFSVGAGSLRNGIITLEPQSFLVF